MIDKLLLENVGLPHVLDLAVHLVNFCDLSVSSSHFGLDFGTSDSGLTIPFIILRVSWSSHCGDVSFYKVRIQSDCANFHGHQCKEASGSGRNYCLSSESFNISSKVTSYQHSAMPGTKYVGVFENDEVF